MKERELTEASSLCTLAFLASSRPFSLSFSLSLCSLFPTPVSLFLTFLVPHRTLFLVLYVHCTNNSSSVSTETSLPAARSSHSFFFPFLFPFFCLRLRLPLSFSCSFVLSFLTSFSFSSLINRARLSLSPGLTPATEFRLNVLIRARFRLHSESSFILSARGRKCREKSRLVRYSVTVTVMTTMCSRLKCDNDKRLPPHPSSTLVISY